MLRLCHVACARPRSAGGAWGSRIIFLIVQKESYFFSPLPSLSKERERHNTSHNYPPVSVGKSRMLFAGDSPIGQIHSHPNLEVKEVEWSNGRTPLPEEYFTGIWDVTNHTRAPRWREPSQAVVCKISFKRGSTIRPFQEESECSAGARETDGWQRR